MCIDLASWPRVLLYLGPQLGFAIQDRGRGRRCIAAGLSLGSRDRERHDREE